MGGVVGYLIGIIGLTISFLMAMGTNKDAIQVLQGIASIALSIAVIAMTSQYVMSKKLDEILGVLRAVLEQNKEIESNNAVRSRKFSYNLGDWVAADNSPRLPGETDEAFLARRYIQKVADGYQVGSTIHQTRSQAMEAVMYRFNYVNGQ